MADQASQSPMVDENKVVGMFVRAEKLRLGKKFGAALQTYQSVLEEQQDFYEAYEKMGDIYLESKKPERAVEMYAMAAAGFIKERKFITAARIYMRINGIDANTVKDSAKKVRDMLKRLPFVDARLLNNHLICDLVPRPEFFKSIPEKEFAAIIRSLAPIELSAGEELFQEGDTEGRSIYMIYSGLMDVISKGTMIAQLRPGNFFGEFSFLNDAPRSATMRAHEDTVVFELNRDTMRAIIREYPAIGDALQQYYKYRVFDLNLAKLPPFSGVSPKDRRKFIEKFALKDCTDGEVILDERKHVGFLFLLKVGQLKITRSGTGNKPLEETLKPNDVFGDLRDIGGDAEDVRVVSVGSSEVMAIQKGDLHKLLEEVPAVQKKLESELAGGDSAFLLYRHDELDD